jgi:predicted Zn-dependent peptidase
VVTEKMRSSQTFNVGLFVGVGSRHESPSLHGASHFLEHVLFKGTQRRSPEEIAQAIESVGGDINAYTAKEHTCFYARVLSTDAHLAVDVLSDMITSSTILSHEVEAERAVILEEIAMHADDPGEVAQELVTTHIFGDTGLGLPVIGSEKSIAALSRQQIVRYWRRHYVPHNIVVVATGQVDHDHLVAQLDSFFSADGQPPQTPRRVPRTGRSSDAAVLTANRRLEQCTSSLTFPSPGLFDDRRYPLGLLSLVLGGGMASRLFVEVRERRGLTYGIDAGETAYSDAGLWSVDWQCAPDKLAEILGLVRAGLLDVAESGVTPDELARAKGQMRGQTVLSFEGPYPRMGRLGVSQLLGDNRTIGDLLDSYDAVTAADIQAEAAQLFGRPPVLAVVGPRVARRRLETILQDWPA